MKRRLRMGMVGGGVGAFIGEVHRKAARMDGYVDIVAGAFSTDPKKTAQTGRELGLDPARCYATYGEMLAAERRLPKGERIDFVSICTPNESHFAIAKACLEAGFHVMCEKPMTLTVAEAEELERLVKRTRLVFGLMHTYTGYPMVKLARDLVKTDFGRIRKVVVQYPQGWLYKLTGKENKQAAWRTDPKRSGRAGCMGDIGTHAANLAEFITGLRITEVLADLTTFVKGRRLDDDGNVLFHMEKGAKGVLTASQIGHGEENDLHIWVYGEKKALAWYQENPNALRVFDQDRPEEVWKRGNPYVALRCPAAGRGTRTPAGHPEGYIEAFANNYNNFCDTIRAREQKRRPTALELDFPTVLDGVRGMKFIHAVCDSSEQGNIWKKV